MIDYYFTPRYADFDVMPRFTRHTPRCYAPKSGAIRRYGWRLRRLRGACRDGAPCAMPPLVLRYMPLPDYAT